MEIENLSQMNDHQLLMELVSKQREQERKERIRTILVVLLILGVCAFVWYQVHQLMALIETVKAPLEELSATIDQYADAFSKFDFKAIESISEAFGKFDPKTLEDLTKNLSDLTAMFEQIKHIFGM